MGNSQQVSGALNYTPGSPVPCTPVVLTLWTAQSVPVGSFLLTVTVTVEGRLRAAGGLPPLPRPGSSAALVPGSRQYFLEASSSLSCSAQSGQGEGRGLQVSLALERCHTLDQWCPHLTAGPTCAHLHLIVSGPWDTGPTPAPSLSWMMSAEIQYQNKIAGSGWTGIWSNDVLEVDRRDQIQRCMWITNLSACTSTPHDPHIVPGAATTQREWPLH